MHDHLAMNGAAVLVFVLSNKRVISVQLWDLSVRMPVPLDVSADRGRVATQSIRDLNDRHLGFQPLRELAAFVQL